MRVLHILEATGGGTRRHVLDLLPALQRRGIRSSLIYSPLRHPQFCDDVRQLQCNGIDTHEIVMGHSYERAGDVKALRQLHAHLKKYRYDLIHCHSSNAGLLGRVANSFLSRPMPVVYTPHYVAFAAGLPPAQRRAARWLERWLAPRTNFYIAVSQHEYALLQRARLLRNNNARVIYNGVDAEQFSACALPGAQPYTIGCFGRLTAQKNQQLLIRALPHIVHKIPDVKLRFVGDGEDASTLRALATRCNVHDRITWRGDRSDLQREYAACDIMAQPSRWEGCSYVLLEAMAASKPIVASTCGGNPEVLGKAGVLLPAQDVARWAQEICALVKDEGKRHELGVAARERVAAHFRLVAMVEKTVAVYDQVLS